VIFVCSVVRLFSHHPVFPIDSGEGLCAIIASMTATAIPIETPQLRPLNILRDLPAVADLVEKSFADTMDADGRRYIQQMRRAGQDNSFLRWASSAVDTVSMPLTGYVWVEQSQIIGNVSLIPFKRERRKYYLIANVAVREDYRRRGIGRALTVAAMNHARQKKADETWLHVRDDNPGAIQLYRDLGFVEKARRTSWQAKPDRNASSAGLGVTFSRHTGRDWFEQEAWLHRIYPDLLSWYQPMNWTYFRPGFGAVLYRFFIETESKNWAVHTDGHLSGVLTWQPTYGSSDRVWAAVPPDGSALALTALLLQARRELAWRQALILDFPAAEYRPAIEAAGFRSARTLLWMRADETPSQNIRTSS
jgi:ribosomal protein S18 acetylase RimI-like enzyme